jgi:L-lactate dehydrogenase
VIPRPVGIIGAGAVGQAVGATLTNGQMAGRLLLASRTLQQAAALAADLHDMRAALGHPVAPQAAPVAELHGCEAVIVAVRAPISPTTTPVMCAWAARPRTRT